jgi:nicotinamide-nucleotide amidase
MDKKKVAAFNEILKSNQLTIVCAESITAGLLSSTIASVSGASQVLKGSVVTYDKALKSAILKVDPAIIEKFTAESAQTTNAMVLGLQEVFPDASIYVAVTGVASPSTPEYPVNKPVGQVYVSIIYKDEMHSLETRISATERNDIRRLTVDYILDNVRSLIEQTS